MTWFDLIWMFAISGLVVLLVPPERGYWRRLLVAFLLAVAITGVTLREIDKHPVCNHRCYVIEES